MKTTTLLFLLLCTFPGVAACKKANSVAATSSAETNSAANPENKPAITEYVPTTPIGIYTMSEIHQKKKITMVPPSFAVRFAFQQDGSFSRISKRADQVVHTDGGKFQVSGKDDLILQFSISDKNPISPPTERTYKFTLSKDGSELSLLGKDGKLALFRRESKDAPR